jgi:23S rRNA pseudouridine1911/1915/1917 synthase
MLNQGYVYTAMIAGKHGGRNLLDHLALQYPQATRKEWMRRLNGGEVTLNQAVADGSEIIEAGELLAWNRPPWLEPEAPRHFDVLFEDEDLLAVSKPSGLPTLPGAGFFESTLLRLVQRRTPSANPVHRLGRATTGIVLFAKTALAAANLGSLWNTLKVQKIYWALAQHPALEDRYEIHSPIGLVPHPRLGSVWAAHPQGKPSRSDARVLARTEKSTTFEVSLHSGRPHQIRIHLAFLGHPLVGDPLYDIGGVPLADLPGLPGDGGYRLHARYLRLEHPIHGREIQLEAALPPSWEQPE